jgi:hypothetical protein
MYIVNAEESSRISDRRMAAIENAELHEFVGGHLAREGNPDLFESRTAR